MSSTLFEIEDKENNTLFVELKANGTIFITVIDDKNTESGTIALNKSSLEDLVFCLQNAIDHIESLGLF